MSEIVIIDIETGPAPIEELEAIMPEFEAPSNYKKPEAMAKSVAEQREKWIDSAALSPMTGRVVSFSLEDSDGFRSVGSRLTERQMIELAMRIMGDSAMGANYKVSGFCIKSFDLPFLTRRAWALGVDVPHWLIPDGTRRFFYPPWIIDLREIWGLGESSPSGSLDAIGRFLGVGGKTGNGKDFHKLYANPETHAQAVEYQRQEMRICKEMCKRFGIGGAK